MSSYLFHFLWHATFRCLHGHDFQRGSWRTTPQYVYATDVGDVQDSTADTEAVSTDVGYVQDSTADPEAVSDPVPVLDPPIAVPVLDLEESRAGTDLDPPIREEACDVVRPPIGENEFEWEGGWDFLRGP